ncbi:WDR11 [Bugula neritina]|uniref:WDR11 n=1 Tax=Bugula neritina TaxID=10212 RepID=A0A7J7JXG9_BUGNE|nr:WDR11 [Bugula neritina]
MKIAARVFPGTLVSQNKGALIWGDHGLIAYAANTTVAVVDSTTMQHVTALHSHRSPITKICWAPSSIPVGDVDDLFLASADTSGFIIIFNVTAGKAKQKLSESNKVVNALELFHTKNSELYLLSLHQPALLILWNPKSGEQIWKKSFSESLSSFSRDPFSEDCIVLNGGGFVQFVKDFSCSQAPSDGTRFFLSSNSSAEPPLSSPSSSSEKNRVTSIKAQISVEDDNQLQLSNLISVKYHCTRRNTLVLVYTQDILILDLDIKQTISVVSLERSTCPFVEFPVYPCRYRDAMYCLHDNGTVVFRIRKLINGPAEAGGSEGSVAGKSSEFGYESHCSSDGMRITKSQKVYGLAVCPVTEMKAAVVTSEGKLLVWELSPVSRHINAGVNAVPST